jgi:hypothetical protein
MGLSSRYYLFADDGLYRMSNRVTLALVRGGLVFPQYASTRQKVAIVILKSEDRKPAKIFEVNGRYYDFDAAGSAAEEFHRGVIDAMANLPLLAGIRLPGLDTGTSSTVVDIGPRGQTRTIFPRPRMGVVEA